MAKSEERVFPATVTPDGYLMWYDPVLGPWLVSASEEEVQGLVDFEPRYHFFFGAYQDDFRYEAVTKEKT